MGVSNCPLLRKFGKSRDECTEITDLVFADDTVIFTESLEILVLPLEALHKEVKPIGLQVSWPKTKVLVVGGLVDETILSSCVW